VGCSIWKKVSVDCHVDVFKVTMSSGREILIYTLVMILFTLPDCPQSLF